MRLHFVPDLVGPAWAGPAPDARFGEAWVGQRALVERLETALGLGGPYPAEPLRAYALVGAVRATPGFWSASADTDPLAVARTLLSWRDELMMHGWRGQPVTERIEQMAAVTADARPGLPDRLRQIADALRRHPAAVEAVHLVEPEEGLPRLWREVLELLVTAGTRALQVPVRTAPAAGDLAAARQRGFAPEGDDSLQLIRSLGPLEAADDVASWLAVQPDLEETVIIAPDAVLDRALARYGLPTAGAPDAFDNVLLQLLPLVLALGWSPPDPVRALELVTLPVSPVPRGIGTGLARSLHRWPAVDSDAWREALSSGLARIEDADYRDRVAERLRVLLGSCADGETYPMEGARERVATLVRWLAARRVSAESGRQGGGPRPSDSTEPWDAALAQCDRFQSLLEASGLPALTRPSLHRLLEEAGRTAPSLARFGDEAGLSWVSGPGAVVGPAKRVVWWSFHRDPGPAVRRLPLSPAERSALAAVGCALPEAGREALTLALRWQRPLHQATEQLVLVCPEVGTGGDAAYPHPLWDEVVARLAEGATVDRLVRRRPRSAVMPFRVPRSPLALPRPQKEWSVGRARVRRLEKESPSSLAALIGCSFRWAVRYMGRVVGGVTTALPQAERLLGSVVHEVLSRVLDSGDTLTPAQAAERAVALFESEGPRMAASVFWPGAEPIRNTALRVIREASRELLRQIRSAGLQVVLVETEVETSALGRLLRGRPDVVLGEPAAVVDLKWGGSTFRRDQLREGAAYQLATYAHLLREPGVTRYPAAAYFILREQRLLTTASWAFPDGEVVAGPDTETTWAALDRAQARTWARIEGGDLSAPANPDSRGVTKVVEDGIDDGVMTLAPPCRFCDLDALCGLRFGAGQ